MFIHNIHICLIWKSNKFSFIQTIDYDLEPNFKVVDNVISDKQVKSFIKYEYKPTKVQSLLTNTVVYDIETFNTIKCVPYAISLCKLIKLSVKYNRDIKEKEYQKRSNECIVF